jgi:hypothetical protein
MPSPGSSDAWRATWRMVWIHAREASGVLIGVVAGIDLELVFDGLLGSTGFARLSSG